MNFLHLFLILLNVQVFFEIISSGNLDPTTPSSYREPTLFNQITCEHEKATIQCFGGRTIRIMSATYGRTVPDDQVCTPGHDHDHDITCETNNMVNRIIIWCDYKTRCSFPVTNERFRVDPCEGTFKYLNLTYKCETNGLRLAATCDDNMTLYIDGEAQASSPYAYTASFVYIPLEAQVIAIACTRTGWNFAGIIGTFSNGEITEPDGWTCIDTYEDGWEGPLFNDSAWPAAVVVKYPNDKAPPFGISTDAEWIWVNDTYKPKTEMANHVYCRHKVESASVCNDFLAEYKDHEFAHLFRSACLYDVQNAESAETVTAELLALFQAMMMIPPPPEPVVVTTKEVTSKGTKSSSHGSHECP